MSVFDTAVKYVLYWEGGLTNDPDDSGGLTNFGVILPILKELGLEDDFDKDGDVDAADLRIMTEAQAKNVYAKQWWNRYKFDELEDVASDMLTIKIFDTFVNMGPQQATRILQRALNATNNAVAFLYPNRARLLVDGGLGPVTRQMVESCTQLAFGNSILSAFSCEQAAIYRQIAAKRPSQAKFMGGWLRRAYSFPNAVLDEDQEDTV